MNDIAANPATSESAVPMLSGSDLYCERDDRVLFQGLTFTLAEGQVLQVVGNNGSGKTTLLSILCGLNDSFEGKINWFGKPVNENRELFLASLLYLGHRIGVNRVLTPLENLRWNCALTQPVHKSKILKALHSVGLSGFEYSQCCILSAGQQQRVSLARLLLTRAQLWVLDEPFTTLDTDGVELLEQLISQHAKQGGAVLVTSHHRLKISNLQMLTLGKQRA
ncbi:MAG: cytochrome c biogenesis heme-transporting ATPase CcmA [Gammaproteobacteria bacterium]|nr:cytochrome c biogenesis heme-transporting ATPase CcmA [Gammaproteobacteria bacterium]